MPIGSSRSRRRSQYSTAVMVVAALPLPRRWRTYCAIRSTSITGDSAATGRSVNSGETVMPAPPLVGFGQQAVADELAGRVSYLSGVARSAECRRVGRATALRQD